MAKYKINLDDLSCSCPDFMEGRSGFERDDPRRLCKHLIAAIDDEFDFFDFYTAHEIHHVSPGRGFPIAYRTRKRFSDENVVTLHIPVSKDRPWVNVFVEQDKFGFNVKERRWAYHDRSAGDDPVEKWITEMWTKVHGKIE